VTEEAGRAFFMRGVSGPVTMLNDGATAYQRYMDHTLPLLRKSGGDLVFLERSVANFMAFATDKEYLAGIGHRAAALEDSRLLPLVEAEPNLRLP